MSEQAPIGWHDLWIPGALLLAGSTELALLGTTGWTASVGLEAVAAVTLVWRRRFPMLVGPLVPLVLMLIPLTGGRMDDAAAPIAFVIVAIYSLARYLDRGSGLTALTLTLLLVFVNVLLAGGGDATDAMFVLSLAVPPYVFGRISRRLAEQSELLASQAEQLRDQAVRDERDRIARELHDVIAHTVSAMVVQTAAAQDLVRRRPEEAAALLESVARTGREALAETGRLLHLIRDEADELGLRPAPGLADVPTLVESFREGGMTVDTDLELPDEPVSGGVDVSTYRVVQEALTNASRYGSGPVTLAVAAPGGELRIRCSNEVNGTAAAGAGLGLQGMAERVAILGGTLRHRRVGDRFELDAVIPLGALR